MRELVDVLLLSLLQGIAEFLPVSSSGHLVLAQSLLGVNPAGVRLEVVLHLGTLASILAYYRVRVTRLVLGAARGDRESWRTAGHIALSSVPAVFFYLLCHDKIDAFFEDPGPWAGFCSSPAWFCARCAGWRLARAELRPRARCWWAWPRRWRCCRASAAPA